MTLANVETTQTPTLSVTFHLHAEMIPDEDGDAITFSEYVMMLPEYIQ
jgi:hypothetical protein